MKHWTRLGRRKTRNAYKMFANERVKDKRIFEDNIEMRISEMEYENANLIDAAQD
jgi:hypothetical protein